MDVRHSSASDSTKGGPVKTARLMVVEDDEFTALYESKLLEQMGMTVVAVASSADEALLKVVKENLDMVLVDINLPGSMSGIELSRLFHDRFNLPVIFVTSVDDMATYERAIQTNPFGYVSKPVDANCLRNAVQIGLYRHELEKKLHDSESRLKAVVEAVPVILYQANIPDFSMSYVSPGVHKLLGCDEEDLLARPNLFMELVHPDDRERVMKDRQASIENEGILESEYRIRTKDGGSLRWLADLAMISGSKLGRARNIYGVMRDITRRKQLEEDLRVMEEGYKSVVANNVDAIIVMDKKKSVLYANPAAERLFAQKADELVGRTLEFALGDSIAEVNIPLPDGEARIAEMSAISVTWQKELADVVTLHDVTEKVRLRKMLEEASIRDDLTKLHNRRGFLLLAEQQMKEATRDSTQFGIFFIDMDNLKAVNDAYGHQMGDQALIVIAKALKATFRDSDVIGRIGGDEFAVLCKGADEDDFERLHNNLKAINKLHGCPFKVSLSVGFVSHDPGGSRTLEELLSEADTRMYAHKTAKKGGRKG
jgi:diguanylate cyclase (GGDEF)-like protein/PAS domain S-box-containing protein